MQASKYIYKNIFAKIYLQIYIRENIFIKIYLQKYIYKHISTKIYLQKYIYTCIHKLFATFTFICKQFTLKNICSYFHK